MRVGPQALRAEPVLERGGRRHELERRAGREQLVARAREQRLLGIGVELVPRVADDLRVLRGEQVRVVARLGDQGEHVARGRVDRRDRDVAGFGGGRGRRGLLDLGHERGHDRGALLRPAEDQVGERLREEFGGVAGEEVVVALLELAPAEHERVEAGLVRVQLGVRVAPLEPERARALAAGREDRRAVRRQDAAAVDLVLGDQLALRVRGVVRDAVGGEHLDVVDLHERDQEQREQGHPELADLPLHLRFTHR